MYTGKIYEEIKGKDIVWSIRLDNDPQSYAAFIENLFVRLNIKKCIIDFSQPKDGLTYASLYQFTDDFLEGFFNEFGAKFENLKSKIWVTRIALFLTKLFSRYNFADMLIITETIIIRVHHERDIIIGIIKKKERAKIKKILFEMISIPHSPHP
jgi:hypothetical protein